MSLSQAKAYLSKLKSEGKTESTSKEAGKVANYIKTLTPDAEERYGKKDLGKAYKQLSRGVTTTGGWTEQNLSLIEKYTGTRPELVSPDTQSSNIDGYFNQFQDSVFSSASSPELRESILSQVEPKGMTQPEPIDYVEQFEQYREQYGVQDLENSLNDLKAQLREEYAIREERTLDAEGKPVAMGVIAGRVSEIERQENRRIDTINREIAYINDQLTTAYGAIELYMNFEKMTYDDARQAYQDAFNKNLQIYKLVDEEMDEQVAAARANLQTYTNLITSGNLSYSDLTADQKTMISRLEVQSGLPMGFVASLRMSPKDQLLSVNDKTGEALMMDSNGNFIVRQTGMTPTPTSTKPTEREIQIQYSQQMDDMLRSRAGSDGKVSPSTWEQGMRAWVAETGGSEEDYVKKFASYVNAEHSYDYVRYDDVFGY